MKILEIRRFQGRWVRMDGNDGPCGVPVVIRILTQSPKHERGCAIPRVKYYNK